MNTPPTPITDDYIAKNYNVRLFDAENFFEFTRSIERQFVALTSKIREWQSMSEAKMRLRCGELSAQDIRNIKAVLEAILPTNNETK